MQLGWRHKQDPSGSMYADFVSGQGYTNPTKEQTLL